MMSIDFINVEDAQTFLAEVSEEINSLYIKEFIYTQIQSQDLTLDPTSKIFYLYIPKIQSYQISVLSTKSKYCAFEPFVFLDFYLKNENNKHMLDLFICTNFFALYDNKKLIYFQNIKKGFQKNDIVKYINQTFKKQIDNIYDINDTLFQEYKKNYLIHFKDLPQVNYITTQNSKNAVYYLSYLAVICILFIAYYFNTIEKNKSKTLNVNKNIKLEQVKKEYENLLAKYADNKRVTSSLVKLFNLLNKNGIKLKSIKIAQNKSQIIMIAKNKDILLNFLDYYDENSTINHMKYMEKEQSYEMVATIKLYK